MSFSHKNYRTIAESYRRSEEFIETTLNYANKLLEKDLPVIFSREHLALILNIDISVLTSIINNRKDCYKYYQIKKKKGGYRQIVVPFIQLKLIQQFINREILAKIDVSKKATGFVKSKSIRDNALIHSEQDAILNIDLLHFFDTITERRVYGIFKSLGYVKNLCVDFAKLTTIILSQEYVANFTTLEHKAYRELVNENDAVLPQGAPSSPTISNLIMRRLDLRLENLSNRLNVNYSRYADDITFSGKIEDLPKIKLLRKIIREEGFNINWRKVGIHKKGRRQMVTGLTVSNNIHVPRKYKNDVKKHIYACIRFGVNNHLEKMGLKEKEFYKEWLLGRIYFINSIEPEVAKKMLIKFNEIDWPMQSNNYLY